MQQLTMVIGNKNFSSWSLRPWLALKQTGAPFHEVLIPLYEKGSKEKLLSYSPSGKVPCLVDGNVTVWDSLAICEYLAEKFPTARLWPRDTAARAVARAVSAEMHSGFPAIRNHLSMNLQRKPVRPPLPPAVLLEIRRVEEIWKTCRTRYGYNGPFLFGEFSIADAMYAPVVTRFENYAIDVTDFSRRYMATISALPAMQEWRAAALTETGLVPA